MRVLSFLCLLLVSYASAKQQFSELQYRNAFTNWMIAHQRHYASDEFSQRYNIFKSNMDFVSEWNSKGSETILGLNIFADITNQEYRNTYLTTPFDVSSLLDDSSSNSNGGSNSNSGELPSTVDWRQKGAVTQVKDQKGCGGCWSFSATASTEGTNKITNGNLVSLSEQNLIDCSGSFGNNGCNGGLMSLAFEYIITNNGIDTEKSYPYTGEEGSCAFNPNTVGARLVSYKNVTSTESDLAVAAVLNPVSVAIDASQPSFQFYQSGIYYEPQCSSTNLDHAVAVVGYGSGSSGSQSQSQSGSWSESQSQPGSWSESQSQSGSWSESQSQSGSGSAISGTGNQSTGSGSGSTSTSGTGNQSTGSNQSSDSAGASSNYWIVKNSWGIDWGMNGYILMSKDRDNNCGIASLASYPVSKKN